MTTSRFIKMSKHLVARLAIAAFFANCLLLSARADEKLRPEQIVAKHLEAIGPAESRTSVTSRIIIGTSVFTFRVNRVGRAAGNAVIASEGIKTLIGMTFAEADYPHERIGYDGRKFSTGFIRPGIRTVLGDFLKAHDEIYKEGLMGGTLTQAWPLLDLAGRSPKLENSGKKKINGRETYVLSYIPKKGTDFDINLYFDAETFQHVRTEYSDVISSQMGGTIDTSARQRSTRYKITEDFSDFKKESGLTLPHNYKIQLVIDNQGGTSQFNWDLNLTEFAFNRPIAADSFNVEAFKED